LLYPIDICTLWVHTELNKGQKKKTTKEIRDDYI